MDSPPNGLSDSGPSPNIWPTLESIFEDAPAVIAVHRGPDHRFVFANRQFRDSSDGRPLIGRTYADAFPEFVEQGYLAIFDRIYATGQPFVARGSRADTPRTPGGPREERYWNLTFQATHDASGQINGIVTFAFEVTEHVMAMRQAEAARQRYDELVAAVGAVVWSVDADWNPLWVRGPLRAVFGCGDVENIEPNAFHTMVHHEERERVHLARASVKNPGERYDVEFLAADDAQGPRWLAESGRVVSEHASGALAIHGLTIDASERHKAQVEREQMREQLLHVQKLESLGVLAGGIAHDFNNLLTAILGNASLAEMQIPRGSPASHTLAAMVTAARRAGDLTRQMLAYSGRGHFKVQPLDINTLIIELAALFGATIPKKVRLNRLLEEGLPLIDADSAQVQQVIMNLVLNGAEAIGDDAGEVTIRTGRRALTAAELTRAAAFPETTPGDFVFADVSDSGSGMGPATLERIFDPFFTTKVGGRGLGLAAVQGIVRGHKGLIQVESELSTGTVFRVFFPISKETAGVRPPSDRSPARAATGATVLVVDDEPSILTLTRTILEMHGYKVLIAADGARAVEVFQAHADTIDLVLLDLTMPRMNGEETYRELSRIRPGIRVIVSSGYNEVEATRRLVARGPTRFIQKPYSAPDLLDLIEAELARSGP